ncbi:hypothetical protein DEJ16_08355 [Curtobacterium sp. MCJR17_055]|nr:hypothetical protein DEJ16_08355 [Curtobacterium sp. MCJR17_055]PYY60267.1 hypothetical protein DEJ26_05475 [Curtobacterium sp. MCPF17_015]
MPDGHVPDPTGEADALSVPRPCPLWSSARDERSSAESTRSGSVGMMTVPTSSSPAVSAVPPTRCLPVSRHP